MDESETGPANFFGPTFSVSGDQYLPHVRLTPCTYDSQLSNPASRRFSGRSSFELYIWAFMLAVGVDKGTSTVIGLLSFGAIFLCVRVYGESEES